MINLEFNPYLQKNGKNGKTLFLQTCKGPAIRKPGGGGVGFFRKKFCFPFWWKKIFCFPFWWKKKFI